MGNDKNQGDIRPWREVPAWVMGANDKWGVCFFAMFANRLAHLTGQIMSDAEVLSAARVIEHLNVLDPTTDRGEVMDEGLEYLRKKYWPPDPLWRVRYWTPIRPQDIPDALRRQKMVGAAIGLPMNADGDGYDFTDDALARSAPPAFGHAVYVVEPGTFITWARPQSVSDAWWDRYCIAVYEIDFSSEPEKPADQIPMVA